MQPNKKLLVLILNREEYLEDILALFLELGISGATILDSVGMGRIVTTDIPVFAGFRDMMAGNRPYNKTILSVVDEEIIPLLIKGVKTLCSDTTGPGVGLIFSLPVSDVWRLTEE